MAGHIAGLGYSVRVDSNGRPLVGWTLTVYEGGTSTPASVYQDYALSIPHTNPIVADASGMLPMFWVEDGTYRVRGLDADGNELFDDDGIVALGPSSGTGGGGSSVPEAALFQTGDLLWQPVAGARSGWVRCNARTIGSAASGATERANADCEDLFLYLWNTYSDSLCPVTGGRGASASADWAANKVIATLDMRGRGPFGLDDMGNTAAGVIASGTSAASGGGAETVTLAQANLPNVTLSISGTTSTNGAHTHTYDRATGTENTANGGNTARAANNTSTNTSSAGSHSHTVSGNTSSLNGGVTQVAMDFAVQYVDVIIATKD